MVEHSPKILASEEKPPGKSIPCYPKILSVIIKTSPTVGCSTTLASSDIRCIPPQRPKGANVFGNCQL